MRLIDWSIFMIMIVLGKASPISGTTSILLFSRHIGVTDDITTVKIFPVFRKMQLNSVSPHINVLVSILFINK